MPAAMNNDFGQPVGLPVPGWTPRPLPSDAPLVGRYTRLERLDAARHAAPLARAFAEVPDGRDWTYLPDEPPGGAYRDEVERKAMSPDPLFFAVTVAGEALGTVALMRIDPGNGTLEVGHVNFARRLQRTRAATEAIVLLMRRAFDEAGYRRLEWKCDSCNAPSRRAAERLGFTFEGVFRQAMVTKGRNRDTAWFGMIDADWPLVRETAAAWLAPGNFDDDGRQLRSLAGLRGSMARQDGSPA